MLKKCVHLQNAKSKKHEHKPDVKSTHESINVNTEDDTVTLTKKQLKAILAAFNESESEDQAIQEHVQNSRFDQVKEIGDEQVLLGSGSDFEKNDKTNWKTNSLDRKNLKKTSSTTGLSKIEKKKIQWQKDKDEFTEWNPWGKPGAGAPLKQFSGSTGDLIYFRGQSPSWSHTDSNGSRFGTPTTAVAKVLPQKITKSAPPMKYVPMAIASSVPLGDDNEAEKLELYKKEEKKRWLLELEMQREEQRLRKENEKNYNKISTVASNGNLDEKASVAGVQTSNLKSNHHLIAVDSKKAVSQTMSSPVPENHLKKLHLSDNFISDIDIFSSSSENLNYVHRNIASSLSNNCQSPNQENYLSNSNGSSSEGNFGRNNDNQRSFLRGHNIPIDEDTKLQLEEKRLKALKLQQEIRTQVEEKARLKQEEKVRLQKEEIEEEKRLLEQQEHLQKQFDLEQQRIKEKKIAEERKRMKIVAEIEKAQKDAEEEKQLRRKCQTPLESGVITYDRPMSSTPDSVKHSDSQSTSENMKTHNVSTSMEEKAKITSLDQIYTTNRILTPSVYRQVNSTTKSHVLCREFGTQTDLVFQETNIKSHVKRHKSSKQTAKLDKAAVNSNSGKLCENNRPKWGVSKPKATYLKQSEKDPCYERRLSPNREKRRQTCRTPTDSDSSTTPTSSEARNLRKENEGPKTQSADSGYEERGPHNNYQMQSDVYGTNQDECNPTSPIIRSNVLLNQPNLRQDRILQQLSDLRQGLMLKQIELQKLISATKSS